MFLLLGLMQSIEIVDGGCVTLDILSVVIFLLSYGLWYSLLKMHCQYGNHYFSPNLYTF